MVLELDSWQLVLGGLFAVAVALQGWDLLGQLRSKAASPSRETKTVTLSASGTSSLRARYLSVFLAVKFADWLQGPYFYTVYAGKIDPTTGELLSKSQISSLFVVGFTSTMVFGTILGSMADSWGRRASCCVCLLLTVASCTSTHASQLWLLYLGRVAGGAASSLLHSSFEAWLCTEAAALPFSTNYKGIDKQAEKAAVDTWLKTVLTLQTFADGCIAVGAGVIAEYALAAAGSPVAVFDLAAILLVIVLVAIIATWGENYGGAQSKQQEDSKEQDQQQQRSVSKSVTDALGTLASDPRVLLQGLVQSLFEGVMYSFVMLWVPALQAKAQGEGVSDIPIGTIFAALMACIMIGSSLFGKLSSAGMGVATIMAAMLVFSVATTVLLAQASTLATAVTACLAFEGLVGMSFPGFGTMRALILPDSTRSTILAFYRIPVCAVVVAVSLNVDRLGQELSLLAMAGALAVAALLQFVLVALMAQKSKTD